MSTDEEATDMMCCAACGIAEVDNTKLKQCACKLVRYCSVECQKDHRSKHKKLCKNRAAELRDELLFKQPETSHLGDCPICFLPQPLDEQKSSMETCCSKLICNGCLYASLSSHEDEVLANSCPFCRQIRPKTLAELEQNKVRRREANDPVAIRENGTRCFHEGDYNSAIEYWTKATELSNDAEAHHHLSSYALGRVVERDKKKALFHLEQAAIGGHPKARHDLAYEEENLGRTDRALKHSMIAAKLGHDKSMKDLKMGYAMGLVRKEDFAAALRGHQAAVDATKSPQRDAAEEAKKNGELALD